jgi:hypothetical protein
VNNCNKSNPNDMPYGFILYAKEADYKVTVFLKPISLPIIDSKSLYGYFLLHKSMFFCVGIIPAFLTKTNTIDSIEVIPFEKPFTLQDIFQSEFSNLDTGISTKELKFKSKQYYISMQPCLDQ